MKRLTIIALAALALCSCAPRNQFTIKGTVEKPELEGAQIFLVPMEGASKETIDSTIIKDGRFQFKGNVERMSEIRIERMKRYGTENLLVVTEPGKIEVHMAAFSSAKGTPQNDSLQAWKGLMMQRRYTNLSNEVIRERTYNMIDALGEESTLGAFLNKMYPRK